MEILKISFSCFKLEIKEIRKMHFFWGKSKKVKVNRISVRQEILNFFRRSSLQDVSWEK